MHPINITVRYDKELQNITGVAEEPVYMSSGSTFLYLLQNIFMAHPEIEKKYSPGTLGFTIDGISPKSNTVLLDGDIIEFTIPL